MGWLEDIRKWIKETELGQVPLAAKREGFRSSFSAKSTSFYADKIWLSHPIRATLLRCARLTCRGPIVR